MSPTEQHLSAAHRFWSIPILRDGMFQYLPESDYSNLAITSWASFRYVAKQKYRICSKGDFDNLMKRCSSQQRQDIYRQSIRILHLSSDHYGKGPSEWPNLIDEFLNVMAICHLTEFLNRQIQPDGTSKFTLNYPYNDTLAMDSQEVLSERKDIPGSFDQVRSITLNIRLDLFSHIEDEHELFVTVQKKLLERIKFYGNSNNGNNNNNSNTLNSFNVEMSLPSEILLKVYQDLLKFGISPPTKLFIKNSDSKLPELINLFIKSTNASTATDTIFGVLGVHTLNYENTTITFEEIYRKVNWNDCGYFGYLNLSCRRIPIPIPNNEQIPIPIRENITPIKIIGGLSIRFIYPPNTVLSPVQLEDEKFWVGQIANIISHLLDWNSSFTRSSEGKEVNIGETIGIEALCATDENGGLLEKAVFEDELNIAFLTCLKEKLQERIESQPKDR